MLMFEAIGSQLESINVSNQWTGYSNTLSAMKGGDSGENAESLARFPIVLNTAEDY